MRVSDDPVIAGLNYYYPWSLAVRATIRANQYPYNDALPSFGRFFAGPNGRLDQSGKPTLWEADE